MRSTLALEFNVVKTELSLHTHQVGKAINASQDCVENRAFLALVDQSGCGPDLSDARTVTKYDTWMTD